MYCLASGPHPLSRGIVQERAPLSPVIRTTSGAESRETHLIINEFLSRFSAQLKRDHLTKHMLTTMVKMGLAARHELGGSSEKWQIVRLQAVLKLQ